MRMRLSRRSHRSHAGPGRELKLDICPSTAPSLAGALCVPFDACVVAVDPAEGYFKIALCLVWAHYSWLCASQRPRRRSLRAPFILGRASTGGLGYRPLRQRCVVTPDREDDTYRHQRAHTGPANGSQLASFNDPCVQSLFSLPICTFAHFDSCFRVLVANKCLDTFRDLLVSGQVTIGRALERWYSYDVPDLMLVQRAGSSFSASLSKRLFELAAVTL